MTAETLMNKLTAAGFKPRSYSGRGMYGAECVACSCERYDVDDARKVAPGARWDSLGMRAVVYWPAVAWPMRD